MHVITHKRIIEAQKKYPESASALDNWYRLIKRNTFAHFAALKNTFPAVDKVSDLFVFDVGGNKLRVICAIHFNTQTVFVRYVLNHKEYDAGKWKC